MLKLQPKMCSKCKKNVAVVFITKMENGVALNDGFDRSGRKAYCGIDPEGNAFQVIGRY